MNGQELVELVRVLRNGRETRESMPRYLAELTLACVWSDEPNTASARIERIAPVQISASAYYPIRVSSPDRTARTALEFAALIYGKRLATMRPALVA